MMQATLLKDVAIGAPNSNKFADRRIVPAGTQGEFIRREWQTAPFAGVFVAYANIVYIKTPFGMRWVKLLDDDVQVSS